MTAKFNGESKKKSKKKETKSDANCNGNASSSSDNDKAGEVDPQVEAGAFSNFRISELTIKRLKQSSVEYLFPIQAQTFDFVYDGHDCIAQARTGTGKTLSFVLPLIEKLQKKKKTKEGRMPRVIVLVPTRELAKQVYEDFLTVSGDLSAFCIYGGVPYEPQERALWKGLDILVGTPGRILDHIQKGNVTLKKTKHVVLDEVDQMLDMGFADSVDEILKVAYEKDDESNKPQTLLFSATMPPWVYKTAQKYMSKDVKKVDLIGQQQVKTSTTVQHLAIKCNFQDRYGTIADIIQVYSGNHGRAIVFCQTKKEADELALSASMKLDAHVLHGDIPQDKRELVLKSFRESKYKVLLTTDVAARGLDIPEVDLVVQCSPPKDVDSYIHRSGRTGRAGRAGTSVLFYSPRQEQDLMWVERKAGVNFKRIGAPTTVDILKTYAKDAARSLDNVPDETLEFFRESATSLIEERGAENALAAALAVISKSTKIISRSLLSSKEGYVSYLFKTNMEIHSPGYMLKAIERQVPEVCSKVGQIRMTKDRKGGVLDIPSNMTQIIDMKWLDTKYESFIKATELPELVEEGPMRNDRRGYGGGGGGGNMNRGGWGRDRNSRGGFSRGGGGGMRRPVNGWRNGNRFDSNHGPSPNKRFRFD